MKWIFFTLSFFVLLSCCTTGLGIAQVVNSSKPMDEKSLTTMQVKVARGYVIIEEEERTLFIDYNNRVLFNLLKAPNVCQQFDISKHTQEDNFVAGRIELFGEFRFIEEGKLHEDRDQRYSRSTVLYAPRAMMLKGVTTARFEQFGITFTPGVIEYVVDQNHGDFDLLVEAAQFNAGIGELNPLIFQLDLTHLFARFAGVPVRKRFKNEVTELSFFIEKENTLRELLPQQCSGH